MEKKNKTMILLVVLGLVSLTVGVSIAFFNYTRTGTENTLAVGRVYFTSSQAGTLNLTNVFPITETQAGTDSTNAGEVTITITGDTTYSQGIEYLVSLEDVEINTTLNKSIPVGIIVTPEKTGELGTSSNNYFDDNVRGGNTSYYKVLAKDTIEDGEKILVGYIRPGAAEVSGTIGIKAFIDLDKIAVSDTYDGNETDNMGTTNDWVNDRTVLTTTEWNSLQGNNAISFKVKIEANEGIWVEDTNAVAKVRKAITEKINAQTNACNPIWVDDNGTANDESDDITYFSGTNACVDMNYVWYSGKLWRITAIYPEGAMKMVTENNITSIAFKASGQVNFYTDANTTSNMYQWLNEDFYDTLYNASSIIDTTKQWNATMPADTTISIKPAETNMVSANVGLLNSYEYYNSYRCVNSTACTGSSSSTGYLNIGYYSWLLNPYNVSKVWVVSDSGGGAYYSPSDVRGTRPSIYLKSGVEFTGSGTNTNPYKIVGDKEMGKANDLINTRLSGEYVKLKNGNNEQVFRIIDIENNKAKIIAKDYADNKATRKFATSAGYESSANTLWGSGTTTDQGTWYTYLNNTYYPNLVSTYGSLFGSSTYYLGTSGSNYKLSVCANTTSGSTKACDKTTQIGTFDIGLPRYGEMFATQQAGGYSSSTAMWLINRSSTSVVWFVDSTCGAGKNDSMFMYGARPTVHLKSTVKILSGSGTENDPYVVGL